MFVANRVPGAVGTLALLGVFAVVAPQPAQAQYPDRPIRLVVPFAPGGVNDIIGRLWAEQVRSSLGAVVIENRGGAGGTIGAGLVAKAPADGYTVLLGNISTQVLNPAIMQPTPYDPLKDFDTVAILAGNALAVVVHPSVPAKTLKELIAHAEANPGKLAYGSSGVGTMPHLAGERFKNLASVNLIHVPYKGIGPARADLVGGHISMMMATVTPDWLALHRAGKVRILAIAGANRADAAPEIPTAEQAGLPKMNAVAFSGLFVPAGTPEAVVTRLNEETQKALADAKFQALLIQSGFDPMPGYGLAKGHGFVRSEQDVWGPIARAAGLKSK